MTSPIGASPIRLTQPAAQAAPINNVRNVQFGNTSPAQGQADAQGPVEEVNTPAKRGFLKATLDGVQNAIFAAPKGFLGYAELACDAAALIGSFFTAGLSLVLLAPGAIAKAIRFVSGFRNGTGETQEVIQPAGSGENTTNTLA